MKSSLDQLLKQHFLSLTAVKPGFLNSRRELKPLKHHRCDQKSSSAIYKFTAMFLYAS